MNDVNVKSGVCAVCGADIRPGSLFCYGCGKAVPPQDPLPQGQPAVHKRDLSTKVPQVTEGKPMRTAAAIRREPKVTAQARNVEWVRPARTSPTTLIAVIILALIAFGLVGAALYIR